MSNNPIAFEENGTASIISYDVPLPSSHTGRRVIALELGMKAQDWTTHARRDGSSIAEAVGLPAAQGKVGTQPERLKQAFSERLAVMGAMSALKKAGPSSFRPQNNSKDDEVADDTMTPLFAQASTNGRIVVPARQWGGRIIPVAVNPNLQPTPKLIIIEVYGISSFLGRYGMGRTVNTFTLLPGEETRITPKTWRSSSETRSEASSIIDSHDESASSRFTDAIQQETTKKSTASERETWQVEASVDASWGWGNADVSAGASGEYQTDRESFARSANEATKEHCAQAASKREMSVSTNSTSIVDTGEEQVVERVLKNVNMRRTLNFVFRELNQEYITKLHLKDIRIAFTNGKHGSYREVPLSGMRGLLEDVIVPSKVDTVAQQILRMISVVYDNNDQPIKVLQQVKTDPDLQDCHVEDAKMVDGEYPAPTKLLSYRFKRGHLNQNNTDSNMVSGVVVNEDVIVMRTDSVCVEALVGGADALDNYALEVQQAAAEARTLANTRELIAHETLRDITDSVERAAAYARMFNPHPLKTYQSPEVPVG